MADDNEDPFDQFAQWCNEHWEGLHHIGEGKIFS